MADRQVYIFLSYTRREEEVAALQPATDAYCDILLNWGRTRGLDIFYDRCSIPQDKYYTDDQLRAILGYNVGRSHVLVSFLSPEYIGSAWCRFEYETKMHLAPRQIHKVYWKPEIVASFYLLLSPDFYPQDGLVSCWML